MKFEIERNLLDQTLNVVSRGLSNKTPMPVLMGIYIKAENDYITFITTNKEISVKVVLPKSDNVRVSEAGDCVVPGKYFVDIVKKIDEGMLEFSTFEESTIKIISKSSDFTLAAYQKQNFPTISFNQNGNPITFSCKAFKQIIRQTTFACASEGDRIILTSAHFDIKDGILSVVGTDSFRLARYQTQVEGVNEPIQFNISAKSLEEFVKTIPDSSENMELYVSSNSVLFKYNNMSFVSRLVDGNYPDTSGLFQKEPVLKIKFKRQELVQVVDRASLFTSTEQLTLVKFNVHASSDDIEIASSSNEIGRVVVTLSPLEITSKQDFLSAFSAKNLLEALRAFDEETVTIGFTGEIKPANLSSDENSNLSQILLPVRTF